MVNADWEGPALVTLMGLVALLAAAPQTASNISARTESPAGNGHQSPDTAFVASQPTCPIRSRMTAQPSSTPDKTLADSQPQRDKAGFRPGCPSCPPRRPPTSPRSCC